MIIRTANLTDVNAVVPLFDAYRVFYKQVSDLDASAMFIKDRIESDESVLFIISAQTGHRPVGFTQLYPLFSSTRLSRTWLLNDLFVDPNYRGQGYSKALLRHAQAFTIESGALSLQLETAKDNLIGNALYPTMGFTRDQDHNYYTWSPPKNQP